MSTHGTKLKVILLAVLVAILLSGWIFLVYKSYSYKNELAGIEKDARNKSSQDSYLISVKNALRDAKDDIANIEKRFVAKDGIPNFISLLEQKAATAGIKADFGSIGIDSGQLSVRMTGSGTWNQVVGFVSTLDSLPYASKIEGITLQKPDPGGATATSSWNFNLSLLEYLDTSTTQNK